MGMNLDPEKLISGPWVPGIAGALVALKWAPGKGWGERLSNLACGVAIAVSLTGGVAEYFGMTSEEMRFGCSFMLGLFGMNFASAIFTAIRETRLVDVLPWRRGGKGD